MNNALSHKSVNSRTAPGHPGHRLDWRLSGRSRRGAFRSGSPGVHQARDDRIYSDVVQAELVEQPEIFE
jgi:hypothetical protein